MQSEPAARRRPREPHGNPPGLASPGSRPCIAEHERARMTAAAAGLTCRSRAAASAAKARAVNECAPNQLYETSARLDDAIHFTSSLRTVGKILAPELAEDGVEGCRTEGQCSSLPFPSFHRCALERRRGPCAGGHSGTEVKADHLAFSVDLCSGQACNYAVPHATSSTRSLSRSAAFATSRGAQGAQIAGTSSASYTSGARHRGAIVPIGSKPR
jgi:hypothetical protein